MRHIRPQAVVMNAKKSFLAQLSRSWILGWMDGGVGYVVEKGKLIMQEPRNFCDVSF